MGKRTFRLMILFSFGIFFIFLITVFVSFVVVIALLQAGVIAEPRPQMHLLLFAVISVLFGTGIARIVGGKVIGAIVEISDATRQIARGNFNIRLRKHSCVKELDEMARNFELMAQELSGIEIFRSDFINNASHEFKTPLAAAEGYAQLLKNRNLSEENREFYLDRILYNMGKLSSMTGNILQLSRLENQEILQEKTLFSLDEQIREGILLFEDDWNEKKLELNVELDEVEYEGNRSLLAQVWQNLIGNAVKFTENGGRIGVFLIRETECVKVRIEDSGIGMDEKTAERIFEKFYQGDTSRSSEGNGLGLALVKRIIDLHGGTIAVRSVPGRGSIFEVVLPGRLQRKEKENGEYHGFFTGDSRRM